jgi:arsenate reductase
MDTERKQKVLFICTHNSARSQMAEGLLRSLYGERYEAFSAGTEPGGVNPHAAEVMHETGIDITNHYSKSTDAFQGKIFDYVVTVCDHAKENCPFFPGAKHYIHKSFPDPSAIKGSHEEQRAVFRKVRDEIKKWIINTFGNGEQKRNQSFKLNV